MESIMTIYERYPFFLQIISCLIFLKIQVVLFMFAIILISVHCAWHNHTGRKTYNNRAFTERTPISLSLWFTNLRTIMANSYRPYWARDGHVVSSIIHHSFPQTSVQFCPLILCSVHILFINFFAEQVLRVISPFN